MKKFILTIMSGLAMSGVALAQSGLISWTTPSSFITAQTNTAFSPLFGGTGSGGTAGNTLAASTGAKYYYELLYQSYDGSLATDTSVWDGTWLDTGLSATNATFAHNLAPVATGTYALSEFTSTQSVVLVGWSANLGASWASVSNILSALSLGDTSLIASQVGGQAAYFGMTSFGYLIGNTSPSPGASVFGSGVGANGLPINSPNMQLYALPVPEPTTIALAGLGGLSLLLFRRRKV